MKGTEGIVLHLSVCEEEYHKHINSKNYMSGGIKEKPGLPMPRMGYTLGAVHKVGNQAMANIAALPKTLIFSVSHHQEQ